MSPADWIWLACYLLANGGLIWFCAHHFDDGGW